MSLTYKLYMQTIKIRRLSHKLYAEIEVTVGVYWVAQKHHVYVIVTMNGLSAA